MLIVRAPAVALLLAALTMAPACDRNTEALSESLDAAVVPAGYDHVGEYPRGNVLPMFGEQSLGVTRVHVTTKPLDEVCEDLAAVVNRLGPITSDPPRPTLLPGGGLHCFVAGAISDSDYSYTGQVFKSEDYLRLYDRDGEVPSRIISAVRESAGLVMQLSAHVDSD